jgi:hypothetical protein
VQNLSSDSFRVYEDDILLDAGQSQLTLLEREQVASHQVVLLVDLGGKLDDKTQEALARGVEAFVAVVRQKQAVSVFVFDGGAEIHALGDFPQDPAGSSIELPAGFQQRDPSRNLNGAVLEAVKALDARLMQVRRPIRIGTLVVLARGADVAGRVLREDLLDQLDDLPHQVIAVGIESEDEDYLEDIGSAGVVRAPAASGLAQALKTAASKVSAAHGSYYLMQYCSPARAGVREVRVEVLLKGPEGEERVGEASFEVDATGFGPGCDAGRTPRFAAAPAAEQSESEPSEEPSAEEPKRKAPRASKGEPKVEPAETPATDDDTIVPPPTKPGYE